MAPTQGEHAQTEALRLADDLEASSLFPGNMRSCNNAAAAELRRLHAQVAALTAAPWVQAEQAKEEATCQMCGEKPYPGCNSEFQDEAACRFYHPDTAQTALAHELFAAAQLAPGEGIEDAVSRIAAALTSATAQPAAPQGVAYAGPSDECDSPELCAVSRSCAGQFGTQRICTSNWQAPAGAATDGWIDDAGRIKWLEWRVRDLEEQRDAALSKAATAQAAPAAGDPAYSEACSLATALFEKHYRQEPDYASGRVVWSLCDTTAGVISQIDNMVSGLARAPAAGAVAGPWKDHKTREIVNQLRDCAKEFHATQQLRERLLDVLGPMIDWVRAVQAPTPAAQARRVLEDAASGMAAEYQRWIDFFHKGNGDYNDFLRIELNHDAARKQGGA